LALDGIFLSRLKHELESVALDARVDKIAQPAREEIVMGLRWRGGGGKLLLSAGNSSPRVHFTGQAPENPKSPPMFCMLLRKHLGGARLCAVRQMGLDRILHLEFSTTNELGDPVRLTLALEIMGRHSNLILIGPEGKILDAIKRVDGEMSRVRQVLPGMTYALPPAQDKLSLFEAAPEQVLQRLDGGRDVELSKALMDALQGASPLLCREIAFYATRGVETIVSDLDPSARERMGFFLGELAQTVREYRSTPTMVLDLDGRPRDFSFLPVNQYGAGMLTKEYPDCNSLLDAFYRERDTMERMKQRSSDLLRLLANTSDRITRKLAAQRQELEESGHREELKIKGDLLSANLYNLQKGCARAEIVDFYNPGSPTVEIELDPRLTPVQNAQRYYAQYRKAGTAEKKLRELLVSGEAELAYVDSVFDALTRATCEADLDAIRQELAQGGYLRHKSRDHSKKQEKLAPLRYLSSDGYTILAGRNNTQNDRLTLKDSRNYDLWLHTQKIPGSHTIVVGDGKEIPKTTIEEAAVIAAYNSKARESAKVPVDFAFVKHVKKIPGAKPGMVTYDNYQTVVVDPDEERVRGLQQA